MPKATLDALIEAEDVNPEPRNALDFENATRVFADLRKYRIDIDEITAKLQVDGVQAFANDYKAIGILS